MSYSYLPEETVAKYNNRCCIKVKNIDTKQSNKRNNGNSKDKREDYNMK